MMVMDGATVTTTAMVAATAMAAVTATGMGLATAMEDLMAIQRQLRQWTARGRLQLTVQRRRDGVEGTTTTQQQCKAQW